MTLMLMNEARRLVRISLVSTLVLTPLAGRSRALRARRARVGVVRGVTAQNLLMIGTVRRLTGMRIYTTLHR